MKKTKKANVQNDVKKGGLKYAIMTYWQYYILLIIPVIYLVVFKYIPMYGVQLAFKDYDMRAGILDSPWVGWDNFSRFFSNVNAPTIILNTFKLSIYSLVAGFPFPILLALGLSYVKNAFFKKSVQMISYAPHFISTVVMVGVILQFFSRTGLINNIISMSGGTIVNFTGISSLFNDLYVWSGIWQNVGFSAIIYIGVLASVDEQLHEAAIVDGAGILKRIWYIDFPTLIPTAVTLFIMNLGQILNVGFEKVYLMQNSLNLGESEIISTYTYKMAFESSLPDYSYTTAIGLFQSLVGFILIVIVNKIANKVSNNGIW